MALDNIEKKSMPGENPRYPSKKTRSIPEIPLKDFQKKVFRAVKNMKEEYLKEGKPEGFQINLYKEAPDGIPGGNLCRNSEKKNYRRMYDIYI